MRVFTVGNDNDVRHCPSCGGGCYCLGQLGKLTHWRCRFCGLDHTHISGDHSTEATGKPVSFQCPE